MEVVAVVGDDIMHKRVHTSESMCVRGCVFMHHSSCVCMNIGSEVLSGLIADSVRLPLFRTQPSGTIC